MSDHHEGDGQISPAEFTRRSGEEELSAGPAAGPGAPETSEPVQGRPGAGGHGPDAGPGGPASTGMAHDPPNGRSGADDARPDPAGAAGYAARGGITGIGRLWRKLRGRDPDR
jgi:hypothetical protein